MEGLGFAGRLGLLQVEASLQVLDLAECFGSPIHEHMNSRHLCGGSGLR